MLYSHQKIGRTLAECHRRVLWPAVIHGNRMLGNYDDDKIWLISSARSGSTWIPRIINWDKHYRELFEPYNLFLKQTTWQPYVRPDADDTHLADYTRRIFGGYPISRKVDLGGAASAYDDLHIKHQGLLVKDVTAHLSARWIANRLPDNVKKIYLLRNPFAVTLSRLKLPHYFRPGPEFATLEQAELLADWLAPFRSVIDEHKADNFYRKLLIWAIENYVFMKQFSPDELLLLFYEDVRNDPQAELERIYDYVGRDKSEINASVINRLRRNPSRSTNETDSTLGGGASKAKWQQELSAEQIARGREILAAFGLDDIYGDGQEPSLGAVEKIMRG